MNRSRAWWRDSCRPVAVTDRSGFDESVHHGLVVVLDPHGDVAFSIGDVDAAIYPRSANKPMQADAMLRVGLELDAEELALACASHDGTEAHLAVVRRILAGAGLGEEALRNTPDLPLHKPSADLLIRSGGHRDSIHMNCSGKHAAMVATCVSNGWSAADYLERDHPLQRAITDHLATLAGDVVHIGVDGCGAPAHVLTMRGLAAGFGCLASERGPVWQAMTEHPELVGGDERRVTVLMRAVPGMMAKDGAEGVMAAAVPGGPSAAIKIADGGARATAVVMAAALAAVGVDVDPTKLEEPTLGHGEPVGRIRAVLGGG